MSRHKWILHRPLAVVVMLAIGGASWWSAGGCGLDQDICGNTRCAIGESCVGGSTCCPDARICGDVCCPEGTSCDSQTSQCTPCPNPTDTPCAVGGCCPAGTVCQDVEGICCDPGEMCCDQVNCVGGCQPISECIN